MKNELPSNEIHREFLGVTGLNPFHDEVSSARMQMFSSHIGQTLVIAGATERTIQTGMEYEYSKYTFAQRMPCNANIVKIIERYPESHGRGSIKYNPETVVIFQNDDTNEFDTLSLREYCSYHQYFGFEYKRNAEVWNKMHRQGRIAEGDVLLDSPNVLPDGSYKYGVQANFAFMSHPATSEDGIVIADDFAAKLAYNIFETRTVEFGSKRCPLNLYGDPNNPDEYKPFPDIGDYIRSDGLLMALRSYDDNLAVVEQNIHDLRVPNAIFDRHIYANGPGDARIGSGRVIDIEVHHELDGNCPTPLGMELQAKKYDDARREFYTKILIEYRKLASRYGDALTISPRFNRLVVEAYSVVGENRGKKITKLYRQAPLDDWTLRFVIQYTVIPTIGNKATDCHGGKGVICHVVPRSHMPVDADGNSADVLMAPDSRTSRMIPGSLYEHYLNSANRDIAKRIANTFAVHGVQSRDAQSVMVAKLNAVRESQPQVWQEAFDYLLEYYRIVSPHMHQWVVSGEYAQDHSEMLATVIREGMVKIYFPPSNPPDNIDMIAEVEEKYHPTYGPVTYVGNSGNQVTTIYPVRIAPMYLILLEKTGDDWTAVSSGKLQHFGVLSQVTNADKHSQPVRNQAIRALGESEARIYDAYAGPEATAEQFDRNNNPVSHRIVVDSVLDADEPTNIDCVIERVKGPNGKNPLGGAKPLQLINHIFQVSGVKMIYRPHQQQ